MVKKMILLLLLPGLACQMHAEAQNKYANYGGLYLCPQNNDLIYIEWDSNIHAANSVYISHFGGKPFQYQIATQKSLSKGGDVPNEHYYMEIFEADFDKSNYILTFQSANIFGRHSLQLGVQGLEVYYDFILIGDEENGHMDADDTQHTSLNMSLNNLEWHYYDASTERYDENIFVTLGMAEDPSLLQVDIGPRSPITYLLSYSNEFKLLAGVGKVDRSAKAYKVEFAILNRHLLAMHFFDAKGEYQFSLAEKILM